jgi:parallel beta-helix repeat protein
MIRLGGVLVLPLILGNYASADVNASRREIGGPDDAAPKGLLAPPGPWQNPPPYGRPVGKVVRVSTEAQLQEALSKLRSNTTVLLNPGIYELSRTLPVGGGVKNIVIRGATDDRNRVVLKGRGMRQKDFGNVPHGITVNDATDVVIANLAVGDVWQHPITLQGSLGCKRVRIFNVRLFDAGEQFLKANPDGKGGGADGCIVEYCVFEFTDKARHGYTQGMSVHSAANWIVRNNLFRNIRGPAQDPRVGGCIDFWNGSRNTTVEGNIIVNCRMGIRFGITNKTEKDGIHDHNGGVIRNNVIWRQPGVVLEPDAGIMVWDSPNTKVLNNTVILNGTFPFGAIDYRWSSGVVLANNLTDAPIWQREQANGREINNVVISKPAIFVNAPAADLHLAPSAQEVLRKVPVLPDCPLDLDGQRRGDKTNVGAAEFSNQR